MARAYVVQNRIYSQTLTMEIKSDPHTVLNFVNDSLNTRLREQFSSKPVKITEFQTLKCLPFWLKNLHYVGAFENPQHNGKKKLQQTWRLFPACSLYGRYTLWEAQGSQHSSGKSFKK